MQTTKPLPQLLISTIRTIDGSAQSSLDQGARAAWLATKGAISPEKIPEVLKAVDEQMRLVTEHDDVYSDQAYRQLELVRAGVLAQARAAKAMFDNVRLDVDGSTAPFDEGLPEHAITGQSFAKPANGHADPLRR